MDHTRTYDLGAGNTVTVVADINLFTIDVDVLAGLRFALADLDAIAVREPEVAKPAPAKPPAAPVLTCETCGRTFDRRNALTVHAKTCGQPAKATRHGAPTRASADADPETHPYACACGQRFTRPNGLSRHQKHCAAAREKIRVDRNAAAKAPTPETKPAFPDAGPMETIPTDPDRARGAAAAAVG